LFANRTQPSLSVASVSPKTLSQLPACHQKHSSPSGTRHARVSQDSSFQNKQNEGFGTLTLANRAALAAGNRNIHRLPLQRDLAVFERGSCLHNEHGYSRPRGTSLRACIRRTLISPHARGVCAAPRGTTVRARVPFRKAQRLSSRSFCGDVTPRCPPPQTRRCNRIMAHSHRARPSGQQSVRAVRAWPTLPSARPPPHRGLSLLRARLPCLPARAGCVKTMTPSRDVGAL
jgi:hypothetical protein